MQTQRRTDVQAKTEMIASIDFVVRASLRTEYADTDFVHPILGKILVSPEGDVDENQAGYIKASLIQFGEAMDHGISTDRLGDGIDGEISEYWERLFDLDTGYWKDEIQNEYEVSECNLLIINCIEVYSKFRAKGVGASAIDRTIDVFGPGCGLVACRPWPLQFTSAIASDPKALKRLKAPNVGKDEAILKLRTYWSKLGFWPLGETGIHVLSMARRGCSEQPKEGNNPGISISGLAGRRVC